MRESVIEILEKKGLTSILIRLFQNHNSIESKYKLEKITNLSKRTIEKRINLLRELNLISLKEKGNSRNTILIELTELGIELSKI